MRSPDDCRFTESHEWVRVEGDLVTIGISKFAADELTDVTFVEMKSAGTAVAKGDPIGEVESVKTTSDVYAPVAGEIVEVNAKSASDPSLVNSDPYGDGWLVRIRAVDAAALGGLMDAAAYDKKYAG